MILDSSILIADERGRFALQDFFSAHGGETFDLAAITVAELWHGVERADSSPRKQKRELHLRRLLAPLGVLAFDADVARKHAVVWAELERRGMMIGAHDLQIAATALHHGHSLATLNEAEFHRVTGLQVVNVRQFVIPARP